MLRVALAHGLPLLLNDYGVRAVSRCAHPYLWLVGTDGAMHVLSDGGSSSMLANTSAATPAKVPRPVSIGQQLIELSDSTHCSDGILAFAR